ncbi:hypothetical protein [Calycomorphotria hydatis]|uniref:Uncharacterized protein n=1 Tax=Calycomorphotria hydatis TaxID=2528027 RepID=A0A517TBI3_9PLAN|nr:hypothetical protein [Calycomorphotria hydatis]QDT65731.1 hypothetical protein V22_29910 [Calycomorphotria hydatis]
MNEPLPQNMADSIPEHLTMDAVDWWESLETSERDELNQLCDARREIFLFETLDEANHRKIAGGKFIPHDDAFGINEWGEDYFQHLLDHPELILAYDAEQRTFHVGCSRHIEARRCFAEGMISKSFQCPFSSGNCRISKILSGRHEVRLQRMDVSQKALNH